jgi:protein-serine/threonine kinase
MTSPSRRPLPTPPSTAGRSPQHQPFGLLPVDMHEFTPYFSPYAHLSLAPSPQPPDVNDETPTTTLPGGTLLHQGFYDLLAMIPTPSPSRLLWGGWNEQPVVAGPRYEDLPPRTNTIPHSPISTPLPSKKGRRISKDMVSKPTGFVCV